MKGKLNIIILCFCMLGISIRVAAQQYGYVQYNSESGAPFDQVTTVLQDKAGFIWIGSKNGLYRFDGIHFDIHSTNTKGLSIHQLHEYSNHLLFINDVGIYKVDDLSTQPIVNPVLEGTIDETPGLPFYPNDFLIGKEGDIWLSQSNHCMGNLRQGDFKTYQFSKTSKKQKLSIQKDLNGGIWILSALDGLFYFDNNSSTFEKKLSIKNGNTLLIHKDYLLIGNDELRVYSLKNDQPQLIKIFELANDDLITAMYADGKDQYLVGTKKGKLLIVTDLSLPLKTVYGANEVHRVEELNFGHIYEIYVTKDGKSNNDQLWVCSETGLWLLQQRFFKMVNSLPMVNPISIAMSEKGKAWSPINYLFEISPEDDGFTAKPILNDLQVTAVAQDKAGFIWVATSTPRVELLKYVESRLIKRYVEFHERGESIFNLYPDSKGNLWFCQAPMYKPILGIAKINEMGEVKYYDETKGFSSRVLAIKEGFRGEIYAVGIGEEGYLYRYNPDEDIFENLSLPLPFNAMSNFEAHDLTIDDRGVVWLATTDGLLRYDGEKISLIENDILGQEEVRGVTHYSNNNIWVSTATKGLVFHQQNTSTALGETEGLPAVINAYRCITTDNKGRLWAGTAEGLVYSRISAATLPYSNPPRVRKIMLDQKDFTDGFMEASTIKKGQELQLHFTNLSYPAGNVEYQYRLLLEEDREILLEEQLWEPIGKSNDLTLSQIAIGSYYLELRARQPGGYQWSLPIEIQLTVFQPWYLKNWFAYTAIFLIVLGISYYFRVNVKKRFNELQNILNSSKEALAKKEIQLNKKIKEYKEQQKELNDANLNFQTLEQFIKGIPRKASWNDIITAMGKAVNQSNDVNAFEIVFKEGHEIVHKGYSSLERSGYTFRSKPFSPKTSLTSWTMANFKEVLINDYDKEHTMYIEEKDAYRFQSLLFIPFNLENNQPVVLCAYSIKKNYFNPNDLVMFRILAKFIYFAVRQEITKEA